MDEIGNKQMAKNLIFNIVSFAINLIISFIFTPYLIKVVGKEAYSFFPLVNNLIGYSAIITTAVGSMAGRFITMQIYGNNIEAANCYFNTVWIANIALSIIFSFLFLLGIIYISDILTIPEYLILDVQWLFAFTAISMILSLMSGLFGLGTFIKNRLDIQASRAVVSNLVRIICILFLFWVFKPSIVYMSLSALIAGIVNTYFNLSLKKQLLPELHLNPYKYFKWKYLKDTLNSGIWNSVNQLSNVLLQQFDLLITNIFIGASATGDYSIAKTAPILILNLLAMLSSTFVPQFNIFYAQGDNINLIKNIKKAMLIISLLIGIPIGFLLIYSDDFYRLWVPGEDSKILYWLTFITVLPMICGGSVSPIFGIFSVTNKLKVPSLVLLFSGILNTLVILYLLKTTDLGIWAIPIVGAIQGVIRNTLFTTMYGAYCLNQKLSTFYPTLLKGIIGMCVVVSIGSIIKSLVVITNWFDFFIVLLIVTIISLIINVYIILTDEDRKIFFHKIMTKIVYKYRC